MRLCRQKIANIKTDFEVKIDMSKGIEELKNIVLSAIENEGYSVSVSENDVDDNVLVVSGSYVEPDCTVEIIEPTFSDPGEYEIKRNGFDIKKLTRFISVTMPNILESIVVSYSESDCEEV